MKKINLELALFYPELDCDPARSNRPVIIFNVEKNSFAEIRENDFRCCYVHFGYFPIVTWENYFNYSSPYKYNKYKKFKIKGRQCF